MPHARYTVVIHDVENALNSSYMLTTFKRDTQYNTSEKAVVTVEVQYFDHCPVCDHEFEFEPTNEDHIAGFCRWECRQSLEDQPGVEDPIGTEEAIDLDRTLYNEAFDE